MLAALFFSGEGLSLNYVPIIATILSGLFALLTAYYAWLLKKRSEEMNKRDRARAERIAIYSDVYVLFESAMHEVLSYKDYTLQERFSKMNAKMELLAEEQVKEQYFECCGLLEAWSKLHYKSRRPTQKVGDMTITTYQRPDPTEQYRKLAESSYFELKEKLADLTTLLRQSLQNEK